MSLTMTKMSIIVAMLGVTSFMLGIVGEHKKPSMGVIVQEKDGIICKYPNDPTVILGYFSLGFLLASSFMGVYSIFYSYNKISVPPSALFKYSTLSIFFFMALACSTLAAGMTLWPTVTEQHHWRHNFYPTNTAKPNCPTAKTGLMGGAAFLSLNSSLFWLVSLMLVKNAREDYLDDEVQLRGVYSIEISRDFL